MTIYKVYEIGEEVNERIDLTREMKDNIETLITSRGAQRLQGNSVTYKVETQNPEHLLLEFNNRFFNSDYSASELNDALNNFANKLLRAEQTSDNSGVLRRKRNITAGILFIKLSEQVLTLMKLESLEIIDRETFEPREEYSTERDYFKLAIITNNDLENIRIVDRNKKIAKYWAEDFLELNRVRDSYRNTQELLVHIKNEKFLNEEVFENELHYYKAKKKIEEVIFAGEYFFNKDDLFQTITQDPDILFINDEIQSHDIYTDDVNALDNEFNINRELIYEEQRKKIKVNEEITIEVKNLRNQKNANAIRLEDNFIRIRVDDNLIEQVEQVFEEY